MVTNVMNEAFTTHFQSQILSTTVDNISTEIVVSDLVRKNSVLLSRVSTAPKSSVTLVAESNCLLSDDNNTITAEVSGYPSLNQTRKGMKTVVSIKVTPLITIADDKMLATMCLYPGLPEAPPCTVDSIRAICNEQEIYCGIDELIIQETIDQVNKRGQPMLEVPVARGLLPVDGNDAYLRFEVETGPLPGTILQDGSIDWRERKIFIGIDKDELIATKIPLTSGTPGRDVLNHSIHQKPGKDISVKVTGDVKYIEEKRQVLATCSGVLSIVNGTDVKVSAKQTINGDVDFSVGNIVSNDGLEIKGDVKSGFIISCKGDLFIAGNIYDATIHANGNSKLASGLLGEKSTLTTNGDVEISFIERASINSGGTLIISKGAYYANVSSKKMILCHSNSKIVGGTFCSCQNFIGGIVGSDNAIPTIIAVGVEPSRYKQRDKLSANIHDLEQELAGLIQRHGQKIAETTVYKKKDAALQIHIKNLAKLNMIPESPLYSRHDPSFNYSPATIAVQGRIFSGTKLRIGNTCTTLTEDASGIQFHIDNKTKHIVATPYSEGKK
jgi:uncharacterized protein (DUF342 family)